MAFLSQQSCLMKIDTLIHISFWEKDENELRDFVKRFDHFTKEKYCIWLRLKKKVKSLFPLKGKNIYPACKISNLLCFYKENYISESKHTTATRWGQHNNRTHDSEPEKHLNKNIWHSYNWIILANASNNTRKRKNLEAIYITLLYHSLNNHNCSF